MTKELSSAEKALIQARKEFYSLANKTTKTLDREAQKLKKQIKRVNVKVDRVVDQIGTAYTRLETTTAPKAKRKIKAQIRKYQKLEDKLKGEVYELREYLDPISTELKKSRLFKRKASDIDRFFKGLDRQWKKLFGPKAKKKARAKKKTVTRKRKAAARKAPAKKAVAKKARRKTTAKRPARKKTAARRKTTAKRKTAKKRAPRKKSR